jgi:hypothetical protein
MYSFFTFAFKVCKKCYYEKYQYGSQKRRFYAVILNLLMPSSTNASKKSYSQIYCICELWVFSFFHIFSWFFAFNFLGVFLKPASTNLNSGFFYIFPQQNFYIIISLFAKFKFKCEKIVHFQTFCKKLLFAHIYHPPFDSYWNSKKSIKLAPMTVHCTVYSINRREPFLIRILWTRTKESVPQSMIKHVFSGYYS